MNKWIVVYCTDSTEWETVNIIIVEAEDRDEIEENIRKVLIQYGVSEPDADIILAEDMYYIQEVIVDISLDEVML